LAAAGCLARGEGSGSGEEVKRRWRGGREGERGEEREGAWSGGLGGVGGFRDGRSIQIDRG
jgi:hypothetical protein